MTPLLRFTALLGAAVLPLPSRQPALNTFEVVVSGGPFAGTYHGSPPETVCMHAAKQRLFAGELGFQGMTKEGVQVRVTAKCGGVDEA